MFHPQDWSERKKKLTLNDHILTSLLVPLEPTSNLISEVIALVTEGLASLAYWGPCSQLVLGTEDQ